MGVRMWNGLDVLGIVYFFSHPKSIIEQIGSRTPEISIQHYVEPCEPGCLSHFVRTQGSDSKALKPKSKPRRL